ncbi:probable leucine--tRNA ligase, mitochondrial isoform X2 [Zootermopsis nevadensis]|uniref:probable leucine--tRNA ligase, mitochondrial isoform X2 n=1 Tax=Zootermopsis nevadensis TaxID=136037 RepID=UPI000B8ED74A|nr:probable leucine--tRNA ligase, mitochondrial isoform X2 [Zootermopsis nevadensis]
MKTYSCTLLHKFLNNRLPRFLCSNAGKWNEDLSTLIKHDIEHRWRNKLEAPIYSDDNKKSKFYVLSMFPYPSGQLHMGHVRVYTISDTMARFYRMNGKNVIHPMGWDAFGLPAENAAIERGIEPSAWTKQNIKHMKEQLQKLGCSFEWDRELTTCDQKYYCWTQFIFLRMYEEGLVYRKEALVNWDPVDQTVLADEQVDANGCSWRSGAKVEKKLLNQWFIRTTRFSKSLLDGLDDPILKNWKDIINLQRHWIGECNGTRFEFELEDNSSKFTKQTLAVFTCNPEHIHYASFIAVAPGSILDRVEFDCDSIIENNSVFKRLPLQAKNPFTGKDLPIYVTDQVEYDEGSDCHLGVPKISEIDRLFATAANIPILSPKENDGLLKSVEDVSVTREHINTVAQQLGIGGYSCSSKLRDWLISRQRYWGTPIPIVYCKHCNGPQPVPYSELPVILPDIDRLSNKGKSLLEATEWLSTKCPKCGGDATRETDTMDTFVDSSWYFLRYLDPYNKEMPFSKEVANRFMPVDLYIGGKEHAVLHLYYARFLNHFLHSVGLVPSQEPFQQLLIQGMVMGQSYRVKGTGRYLPKENVDLSGPKPVEKVTGQAVVTAWEKMSKSKHNGVDPETMLKEYGTDTTRLLILADVAPTSHRHWNSSTFPGILKWQHRLWLTMRSFLNIRSNLENVVSDTVSDTPEFKEHEAKMFDSRNYYLKGVTFNYTTSFQLSVAISKMQGLTNSLRQVPPEVIGHSLQFERALACLIIVLAPMAPHFASELWSGFVSAPNRINTSTKEINWDRGVLEQTWPEIDLNYCLQLVCMLPRLTDGPESIVYIKTTRTMTGEWTREEEHLSTTAST